VLFLVLWRASAGAMRSDPLVAAIAGAVVAAGMLAPLAALVEPVRWFLRRTTSARRDAAP
jgi:hypothetical protein